MSAVSPSISRYLLETHCQRTGYLKPLENLPKTSDAEAVQDEDDEDEEYRWWYTQQSNHDQYDDHHYSDAYYDDDDYRDVVSGSSEDEWSTES